MNSIQEILNDYCITCEDDIVEPTNWKAYQGSTEDGPICDPCYEEGEMRFQDAYERWKEEGGDQE